MPQLSRYHRNSTASARLRLSSPGFLQARSGVTTASMHVVLHSNFTTQQPAGVVGDSTVWGLRDVRA